MRKIVAALTALLPVFALAATETWNIDSAHTTSGFAVRHMVISTVRGQFAKTTGSLKLDSSDLTSSSVEAVIDATTIDTREPKRDVHLKSPDFFDVEKYPTIAFRSTKVSAAGEGKYTVAGDLTLHGVTKPVVLELSASPEVKGAMGEKRRGFTATTRISRKGFGLTWNKVVEAGPVVSDDVAITLDVEATQPAPAKSPS